MSLTILTTPEESLVSSAVVDLAVRGLAGGAAVLFVPTFAQALQVQKELAQRGLSLGLEVGTPRSWLRDRWDVWGDGRRTVDGGTRALLMAEVLEQVTQGDSPRGGAQGIVATPGTVRLMCDLAERALPWLAKALDGEVALTPAEHSVVRMVLSYGDALERRGLVESVTCSCELPARLARAGVAIPPVVLAGFDELSCADAMLAVALARETDVTLVVRTSNTRASQAGLAAAKHLASLATEQGVPVCEEERRPLGDAGVACGHKREPELDTLLRELFCSSGMCVSSTGAVCLLEPSGPLAEAELVAREVAKLTSDGKRDVVVVAPDVRRAWRELAPKLVARGVGVSAQLGLPVLGTRAGRAFLSYARTVAQLRELAGAWPEPKDSPDGPLVRLGTMDWWPPQELVDFLSHDMAQVDPAKAQALDVSWRGNRLLGPQDVLDQLLSAKTTSDAVERATRELLRGRLGSAASKLLAAYAQQGAVAPGEKSDREVSLSHEEAVAVLAAVMGVAGTLKDLGISADPSVPGAVSLEVLIDKAELVLGSTRIALRPVAHAQEERGIVRLLGRSQAAALPPASADAVVLCGLTSKEMPVPSANDELTGMLEDLGVESPRDALAMQRALFWRVCAAARETLLLERVRYSASAKEAYPCVMLTELMACYGNKLPCTTLPEDQARANLGTKGIAPESVAKESVAGSGHIHESLRRLVSVPQEGRAELPGGLPVLSASQLESYLECPLKWFSLRRLKLQNNDAGFGPLEMGTFAHRVLELTYGQLAQEGRASLNPRDMDGMAHAHQVLDECFRAHLERQYLRSGSHAAFQALVAHSPAEQSAVDRLHRDLSSTLDYEASRLQGFVPCAFEWEFGRGARSAQTPQGIRATQGARDGSLPPLAHASYAGVRVTGTVDRIDKNAQDQVVIVDYKHKGPAGFFAEYAALKRLNDTKGEGEFVLPRRIQALLYAQVVRRAFPHVRIVGALYLGTRGDHELSGAVDECQVDTVFGGMLGPRRANNVVVMGGEAFGQKDERGMNALLDATEEAVSRKVERLREGHIEANPVDAAACSFCPVANCERRLQS